MLSSSILQAFSIFHPKLKNAHQLNHFECYHQCLKSTVSSLINDNFMAANCNRKWMENTRKMSGKIANPYLLST